MTVQAKPFSSFSTRVLGTMAALFLWPPLPSFAQISTSGDVFPNFDPTSNPAWAPFALQVGVTGDGEVMVQSGGRIDTGQVLLGVGASTEGIATISGSNAQVNALSRFAIGFGGEATVRVEDGGVISSGSGAIVGRDAGSSGLLEIIGANSLWVSENGNSTNASTMYVGGAGDGTVNIESGGTLRVEGLEIGGIYREGTIRKSGGSGAVNVRGAGSELTIELADRFNTRAFNVGQFGDNSSLNVELGAAVHFDTPLQIGGSSEGHVLVSGAGSKLTGSGSSFLIINNGSLRVVDGGAVTTPAGGTLDSDSSVTVSGDGSVLSTGGDLIRGNVFVENGGKLSGERSSVLGVNGKHAAITVSGEGSNWHVAEELSVGPGFRVDRDPGSLTIDDGGSVIVDGTLNLRKRGELHLLDGTLSVGTLDVSDSDSILNLAGGTLEASTVVGNLTQVDGVLDAQTIQGSLVQEGGILAPGNSPGTTQVFGNYDLTQGTISIEIAGETRGLEYDFVDVSGVTSIDASSASLNIEFLNDFQSSISVSDTFTILNSEQGLTGTFAGLEDGATIQTSDGSGTFRIGYTGNSVVLSNFVAISDLTGDFNNDGDVDIDDINFYVGNIGSIAEGPLAQLDLDNDGQITLADQEILITNFVQTSNGENGTFVGDLDLDGTVDVLGDAFALIGNLGNEASSYAEGDINLDGNVDVLGDAFLLVGNLGNTNSPSGFVSQASVPEPSTACVLVFGVAGLALRRRK